MCIQYLEIPQHTWGQIEGGVREHTPMPGVLLFMGVKSRAPSLLVSLNRNSKNLKSRKRKNKWSK